MANQLLLLHGNPRKSRKKRSAAQRAATARMLAANRAKRNPRKTRSKRRSSAAPRVVTRTRTVVRRARRSARRLGSRIGFQPAALMGMAKNAAIGAGGAILVDVAMGYGSGVLPASVTSRVNAEGGTNWMYYAAKGAIAVGVGVFGGKVIGQATAARMAEGALTVMAYEILRSIMPAGVTLGYYNSGVIANANSGMGKILPSPMGRVIDLPQSANPRAAMRSRNGNI